MRLEEFAGSPKEIGPLPEIVWQILPYLRRLGDERKPSGVELEVSSLFCEMRPALIRYLHSYGLSVADGEDVVQEVFLRLFHHLREGKPNENIRGWIFRVARNLALRHQSRGHRNLSPADEVQGGSPLVDPAPNPEEHAAMECAAQRVLAVLKALPERDRQCLFLRAEGMRYREIAEALEISLGTVAASLSRSLAKLSSVYQR
jgi:RNA polymerase sigma-70 factor (ECF subfamily)